MRCDSIAHAHNHCAIFLSIRNALLALTLDIVSKSAEPPCFARIPVCQRRRGDWSSSGHQLGLSGREDQELLRIPGGSMAPVLLELKLANPKRQMQFFFRYRCADSWCSSYFTHSEYKNHLKPFEKCEQSWVMALHTVLEGLLQRHTSVNDLEVAEETYRSQLLLLTHPAAICCPCDSLFLL